MSSKGTLVFFCGKMGAGKSTKAREMAAEMSAILLSEDEWLATIYPGKIKTLDDYVKYSSRLKPILKGHVRQLLKSGVSVVMDFHGNTQRSRAWFKEIVSVGEFSLKMIYLDVSDEVCLEQIDLRRKTHPERAAFDTEEVFHQVTSHFQPPSDDEGFM